MSCTPDLGDQSIRTQDPITKTSKTLQEPPHRHHQKHVRKNRPRARPASSRAKNSPTTSFMRRGSSILGRRCRSAKLHFAILKNCTTLFYTILLHSACVPAAPTTLSATARTMAQLHGAVAGSRHHCLPNVRKVPVHRIDHGRTHGVVTAMGQ